MSNTGEAPASVIPAQLGFLAIYNPSLGTTDETLHDQIVYYTSKDSRKRNRSKGLSKDEQNERLRQIGLAQGMVDFGRNFSEGRSVDLIETEKSRIILYELEAGWWILASIDLTRLPSPAPKDASGNQGFSIEYSSREVKPAALLLQDLVCAHKIFLLHHASSVSALFVRNQRQKFIGIIGRYWDTFTATWNVLLHGNPAVKIYGGIKLAACGELGVGVGEEERGSGERAVLEGFASSVKGLVDIVVSKFGEAEKKKIASHVPPSRPWLGSGEAPTHEDGAIFLGVGALSRDSLRDITVWMEDLYTWGNDAYGVLDNPSSTRRKKVRKSKHMASPKPSQNESPTSIHKDKKASQQLDGTEPSDLTTPISPGTLSQLARVSSNESTSQVRQAPSTRRRIRKNRPTLQGATSSVSPVGSVNTSGTSGKFLNMLKLGYGTHWSLPVVGPASNSQESGAGEHLPSPSIEPTKVKFMDSSLAEPSETPDSATRVDYFTPQVVDVGHYLIGLIGDIEDETTHNTGNPDAEDVASRIFVRTLTVELEGEARAENEISIDLGTSDTGSYHGSHHGSDRTGTSTHATFESQDRNKTKKLRVVVYVHRPFIYTFLFEPRTDSLSWHSLYRALHRNLIPLQKPLLQSTTYRGQKPSITTTKSTENDRDKSSPIYDLVWDPKALTISTSIPDIPSYSSSSYSHTEQDKAPPPWSRVEALTTHSQILSTFKLTRHTHHQSQRQQIREQTCKTSRGYWISWYRIPQESETSLPSNTSTPKNANTNDHQKNSNINDRINFNSTPNWSPKVQHWKLKVPSNKSRDSNNTSNEIIKEPGTNQSALSPATKSKVRSSADNTQQSSTPNLRNSLKSSQYSGPAHPFTGFRGDGGGALDDETEDKEVFLVRKAGSSSGGGGGGGVGGVEIGSGVMSGGLGWMAGMGVDTKRYVDGLLALGRSGG